MRRLLFGVVLFAAGAALGATPTPTPTPKTGAIVQKVSDLCWFMVPGASSAGLDCGYVVWDETRTQDPATWIDVQYKKSGSNACLLLWLDLDGDGTTKEILTPSCLAPGASVRRIVNGRGARLGVTIALTPVPNGTPPAVAIVPNGNSTLRVYPARTP